MALLGHNGGTSKHQKARHGGRRAGRWPVQLRYACALTGAQYVTQQAWEQASLPRCPLHPQGGCGLARHGTYRRVSPPGTRVAHWYCRRGHRTFSLLPDCLAARLSGTLSEVEAVVRAVEQAASLEAACQDLRPDIEQGIEQQDQPCPDEQTLRGRAKPMRSVRGHGPRGIPL